MSKLIKGSNHLRTDELFYEFFQLKPDALIQLLQLNLQGRYVFESITLKRVERRIDGFFRRTDGEGPNLFLEVQGYGDKNVVWRLFQELTTYYLQSEDEKPFIAIVLYVDEKYDPKELPFSCFPPNQLIQVYLVDNLKKAGHHHKALMVLEPLVLESQEELAEKIPQWKATLDTLDSPESEKRHLIELLTYAIVEKFSKLTREEIEKMLKLTPLDETVAGKELIQIGKSQGLQEGREEGREEGLQEGREEGLEKGKLIGQIHMTQNLLKQERTPEEELIQKRREGLQNLLQQLQSQLNRS